MEQVDVLLEPLRVFLTEIGVFLPKLAIAIVVLVGGWILAKLARFAIVRGLRAVNFPILTERAGIDGFLRQGGIQSDMTALFGVLAYWLVILAALIVAFNGLGLAYVTDLLGRVMLFVPRLIVALLVLVFGSYFGRFIGNAVTAYCSNVGIHDADLLGDLAHHAVVAFVVLIALDQMQIGGDIIRQSFLIILAGVVLALALAFGIGGSRWAAALLERWWPQSRKDRP
jgi:mechanosensitive ion channel-like protein